MEERLEELTKRLQKTLGDRVVSVTLYGSAAAGDWQERASDLNILCVLKEITSAEMRIAQPVFEWWVKQGNATPLLMTEAEIERSSDCFALEFHDIQERHRVLMGRDVTDGMKIDYKYYRALVEKELRSKQIRLRQKAIELFGQPDRQFRLMSDSVSTFCALGRHALLLGKRPARWKKQEVLAALSDATGSPLSAANQLLAFRESGGKPEPAALTALLDEYLRDTEVIVSFVDSLENEG